MSEALDKTKAAEKSVPHGDSEGPRRSQRLTSQAQCGRLHAELDQCRAQLLTKSQGGRDPAPMTRWCGRLLFVFLTVSFHLPVQR